MGCEYCKTNSLFSLNGFGCTEALIEKSTMLNKHYIKIKAIDKKLINIEIKYCPMCGRQLI